MNDSDSDVDPEQMDIEFLKQEYIKEKNERKRFRRIYSEV